MSFCGIPGFPESPKSPDLGKEVFHFASQHSCLGMGVKSDCTGMMKFSKLWGVYWAWDGNGRYDGIYYTNIWFMDVFKLDQIGIPKPGRWIMMNHHWPPAESSWRLIFNVRRFSNVTKFYEY